MYIRNEDFTRNNAVSSGVNWSWKERAGIATVEIVYDLI